MALLLITHDLGVVAEYADRMCVMYGGEIVEAGDVRDVFRAPAHPYTRGLLGSVPSPRPRNIGEPRPRLQTIEGTVPPLGKFPTGCRFRNRCNFAVAGCEAPDLSLVACAPHPESTAPPISAGPGALQTAEGSAKFVHVTRCWRHLELTNAESVQAPA
jgi:oligopeptide/dipeptide ABC transporter ATP-binding protein